MGILEGKVVIVTGGGQGIGEGLVYACCQEGAKVANLGRTVSKVERVVNRIKEDGCEAMLFSAMSVSALRLTLLLQRSWRPGARSMS